VFAVAAGAVVVTGGPAAAWFGPAVSVSPETASPGATVTAQGLSFDHDDLVKVRMDSLNGDVVATFTPNSGDFQGPLVVPPGTPVGDHTLWFTQNDATGAIEEMPQRALLVVTGAGGQPLLSAPLAVDASARRATLALSERRAFSLLTLIMVALASAGLAALVALGVVSAVRRRGVAEGGAGS
jgi:hypothetical protein